MKAEHKILLELCNVGNNIQVEYSKEELQRMDWANVLWQTSAHKIDTMVARKSINGFSWGSINRIIAYDLYSRFTFSKARNTYIYEKALTEILEIISSVTENFVFTKGTVSAVSLYSDIGERTFRDIDILINKDELQKVKKAFLKNGYVFGTYRFSKNSIEEARPETIKYYEMVTHQASTLVKMTDSVSCESIPIDLNFGLGPESNLKDKNFIGGIIERRVKVGNGSLSLPSMSKEDMILHCCVHICRDSTFLFKISENCDTKLYQYADLLRMILQWHGDIDWDYLLRTIIKNNLANNVFYALYYIHRLFENIREYIKDFMKEIEPKDKGYLDMYGLESDEKGVWDIPFEERLFENNRYSIIKDRIEQGEFIDFHNRKKLIKN